MYKSKSIGVVVPAYNEERFITTVTNRVPIYVDKIYIIDDASSDNTFEIASRLAGTNPPKIHIIKHEKNCGVGKSIVDGYKQCLADNLDIAVVMAGDNQMDPEKLPDLLDPIIEGKADYTAGDRLTISGHTKGMTPWRQLGNRTLRFLTRIAAWNFDIADPQHGYAAITSAALMRLDIEHIYPRYGYLNDLLVKMTVAQIRILYIPMPAVYGDEKSKIQYWHYIPTVSWLLLKAFLWRIKTQSLRLFHQKQF